MWPYATPKTTPFFTIMSRILTEENAVIIYCYIVCTLLQEYTYDFEVMQNPLRTYQLVAGATGAMLTEKMIFSISHDDEQNQCAVCE